jgi:hypothetical protein
MVASIYQGMRIRAREKEEMPENAFDSPKKAFNYIAGAAAEALKTMAAVGAISTLIILPSNLRNETPNEILDRVNPVVQEDLAGKQSDDAVSAYVSEIPLRLGKRVADLVLPVLPILAPTDLRVTSP